MDGSKFSHMNERVHVGDIVALILILNWACIIWILNLQLSMLTEASFAKT